MVSQCVYHSSKCSRIEPRDGVDFRIGWEFDFLSLALSLCRGGKMGGFMRRY